MRIVTVHYPGYDPDVRLDCPDWLTARAVTWDAHRRGRWVTVVKHPGPFTKWWTRRKGRLR